MEIERKYLVHPTKFDRQYFSEHANVIQRIQQGYFTVVEDVSLRVRLVTLNKNRLGTLFDDPWRGSITLKTQEPGISRQECEGATAFDDAAIFMELCPNKIMKDRFSVHINGFVWEIDDFGPPHEELIICEIELPSVDTRFEKPEWVGEEVTAERDFYNENLNSFCYVRKLEEFLGWKIPK